MEDPDAKLWHYVDLEADQPEQRGPVPARFLKERFEDGRLSADTPVWCEGMEDWSTYGKLLKGSVSLEDDATAGSEENVNSAPEYLNAPPAPKAADTQQVSPDEKTDKKQGSRRKALSARAAARRAALIALGFWLVNLPLAIILQASDVTQGLNSWLTFAIGAAVWAVLLFGVATLPTFFIKALLNRPVPPHLVVSDSTPQWKWMAGGAVGTLVLSLGIFIVSFIVGFTGASLGIASQPHSIEQIEVHNEGFRPTNRGAIISGEIRNNSEGVLEEFALDILIYYPTGGSRDPFAPMSLVDVGELVIEDFSLRPGETSYFQEHVVLEPLPTPFQWDFRITAAKFD